MQYEWYAELSKPFFAPPAWIFGPVWTLLYVLIAIAGVLLLLRWRRGEVPTVLVLLFAVNLAANLLYTPLQFSLRSFGLAMLDVLVILGTLVWFELRIRPLDGRIFWLLVPYLAWVSFAAVLQLSVTVLNPQYLL